MKVPTKNLNLLFGKRNQNKLKYKKVHKINTGPKL